MKGSCYVLSMTQKTLMDMDYNRHKSQLGRIQSEDRKKKLTEIYSDVDRRINHGRGVGLRIRIEKRCAEIDKQNTFLLKSLDAIATTKKKKPAATLNPTFASQKSLNVVYRKKELQRIADENEQIAKRLSSQHSFLNRKKLESEFMEHVMHVQHIQKVPGSPDKNGKLPPIKSSTTRNSFIDTSRLKKEEDLGIKYKRMSVDQITLGNKETVSQPVSPREAQIESQIEPQIEEELNQRDRKELFKSKSLYKEVNEDGVLEQPNNIEKESKELSKQEEEEIKQSNDLSNAVKQDSKDESNATKEDQQNIGPPSNDNDA